MKKLFTLVMIGSPIVLCAMESKEKSEIAPVTAPEVYIRTIPFSTPESVEEMDVKSDFQNYLDHLNGLYTAFLNGSLTKEQVSRAVEPSSVNQDVALRMFLQRVYIPFATFLIKMATMLSTEYEKQHQIYIEQHPLEDPENIMLKDEWEKDAEKAARIATTKNLRAQDPDMDQKVALAWLVVYFFERAIQRTSNQSIIDLADTPRGLPQEKAKETGEILTKRIESLG